LGTPSMLRLVREKESGLPISVSTGEDSGGPQRKEKIKEEKLAEKDKWGEFNKTTTESKLRTRRLKQLIPNSATRQGMSFR